MKFRRGSKTLVRSLVLVFKRLKQLSKLNVFVIKVMSHERKKKSIQVSFIIFLGITNLNWFMEYLAEEIISLKNITCFFCSSSICFVNKKFLFDLFALWLYVWFIWNRWLWIFQSTWLHDCSYETETALRKE